MSSQPITVDVTTEYLRQQSKPDEDRFAFAYHITIHNQSQVAAKLMSRHWVITDGNEAQQEVRGAGVIGEQPTISPGQSYQYSSGVILDTPIGTMHGSYTMLGDDGNEFDAPIKPFLLAIPHAVN
jgi:ApaG protein